MQTSTYSYRLMRRGHRCLNLWSEVSRTIGVKVLIHCTCTCMYYNVYVLQCTHAQGKVGESLEHALNMTSQLVHYEVFKIATL